MEQAIIFDTHRFVKRMTDAGLSTSIAEALADEHAQLLIRNLATQHDIGLLQQDILAVKQDIAKLRTELAEKAIALIKWNVGTMMVFGSLLVVAIKFL